jgi:hypothetical protein
MWHGTLMSRYKDLSSPQQLRALCAALHAASPLQGMRRAFWDVRFRLKSLARGRKITFVNNGGWHFSYLGGAGQIIAKLESFSHQEYNRDEYKDSDRIQETIRRGADIFNRPLIHKVIPLDETFPHQLLRNQDKFSNLIFRS